MSLDLIPVTGGDAGLAAALVEARLPVEDLGEAGRTFFRVERDGATVGFAGYEAYGADALLRSVVVLPERRGRGDGRAVTEAVLGEARRAGVARTWLLTTSAEAFFTRLGFDRAERADAPAAILETRQAATICSSATLMRRTLA